MKKIRFLIPLIVMAALATTGVALEKFCLLPATQTVAPASTLPAARTAVQNTSQTAVQTTPQTAAETTPQTKVRQNTDTDMVAINGITVNRKKLIDNLDKTTDETISYVYSQSPNNITIGNLYEGYFSDPGKPELFVIFKLLGMPHAGGLDCSVTALYDKSTLDLITQKTFPYDECKFSVMKDVKQRSHLLFVGSTTYQGRSQYIVQLYKPGKAWEKLYSAEPPVISELLDDENNIKYELSDDGSVWVYRPVSFDAESQQFKWGHEYNLVWNKDTCTLDETVPETYTDAGGNKVVYAVSVSPDGKYAISLIRDSCRMFLYDTDKNILAGEFDMPAQDYGFLWSPDNKKVCVTRTARIWIESSIVDAVSLKAADITFAQVLDAFKSSGIKLAFKLHEVRPDPYIAPIEWSPDGQKILMSYQCMDSVYRRQNGTFVYDTRTGKISRLAQNKADPECGNLTVPKPKDFKW